MARPSKESRELTMKDVEKGIALARKLMNSYTAILDDPDGEHPSERQLEAVGKFLKDNGITLEPIMAKQKSHTANSLDDDDGVTSDGKGTKKMSKKEELAQLPFTIDEHGNSIPNPYFASKNSPSIETQPKSDLM